MLKNITLKSILVITSTALLAACTTPESLTSEYEQACQSGHREEVSEIMEEMLDEGYPNGEGWTDELIERIRKVAPDAYLNA